MKRKHRVLIAHDHLLVCEAIHFLLQVRDFEPRMIRATENGALKELLRKRPDVIVLALHILPRHSLDAIRRIKRRLPQTKLVIFASHAGPRLKKQLFDAGITNWIGEDDSCEALIAAIRSAVRDKRLLSRGDEFPERENLTLRERQMLAAVGAGKTNKEIAADLGISTRTAEVHRASLMRKIGAFSTAETVRYAIRNRIIEA